jgi:two-component system, chemotaxis family, protein-glutamate methylesterase/glutaminase
MTGGKSLSVLVVDDSAVARQLMTTIFSSEPDIRLTTATDPLVATERIRRSRPDVILLDLRMPKMDGLTFLTKIMAEDPIPVVICSGFAEPGTREAVRALQRGAVDIVLKPRAGSGPEFDEARASLLERVRAAAQARLQRRTSHPLLTRLPAAEDRLARRAPLVSASTGRRIVAIGASTGGTEALTTVLKELPQDAPALVIAQHMPAGFTAAFAKHLNEVCRMDVREPADGEVLQEGRALIAPGDRHMMVRRRGSQYFVELISAAGSRYRPGVDVLFRSVASAAGPNAVGIILTGMGSDGAEGLLEMRRAGADTVAQDQASCVVFGMPKEAIDLGAARTVLPLSRIAAAIEQLAVRRATTGAPAHRES